MALSDYNETPPREQKGGMRSGGMGGGSGGRIEKKVVGANLLLAKKLFARYVR